MGKDSQAIDLVVRSVDGADFIRICGAAPKQDETFEYLLFTVEVVCDRFSGVHENVTFMRPFPELFLEDLKLVSEKSLGSAKLENFGPESTTNEFCLEIFESPLDQQIFARSYLFKHFKKLCVKVEFPITRESLPQLIRDTEMIFRIPPRL